LIVRQIYRSFLRHQRRVLPSSNLRVVLARIILISHEEVAIVAERRQSLRCWLFLLLEPLSEDLADGFPILLRAELCRVFRYHLDVAILGQAISSLRILLREALV